MDIKGILKRRDDLGTFLVHLTREYPSGEKSAKENLKSILEDREIEARNPYGSACIKLSNKSLSDSLETQKVVCFTETPLQYLHLLTKRISGRKIKYEPYGIAITRIIGRKTGINPVWYLDITQGHDWLVRHLNNIIDKEIQKASFKTSDIAKLTPYIEQMGVGDNYFKEYWWEREWRYSGNYTLPFRFIVICPEDEKEEIFSSPSGTDNSYLPSIDASWGLEQIICRLAGFTAEDIEPFSA